jgi:hypothetical protein
LRGSEFALRSARVQPSATGSERGRESRQVATRRQHDDIGETWRDETNLVLQDFDHHHDDDWKVNKSGGEAE